MEPLGSGRCRTSSGLIEHVLTLGPEAVDRYLRERRRLGFDIVGLPSGFLSVPDDDLVRLVSEVRALGMLKSGKAGVAIHTKQNPGGELWGFRHIKERHKS